MKHQIEKAKYGVKKIYVRARPYLRYVLLGLLILLVGFGLGYAYQSRVVNKRIEKRYASAQKLEAKFNKRIDSLLGVIAYLEKGNAQLAKGIYQDSIERSAQRSKIIPMQRVLKDEANVLLAGGIMYGGANSKNTKRALVASYGAQAIDEVQKLRRINTNLKVQAQNYEQIVAHKDTILVEYKEGLEYAAKKCKRGKVSTGIGIGVIGTILLGVLLL